MSLVRFGVDALIRSRAGVRGSRIGLLTNDAARTAADVQMHSRVGLIAADVPITLLLSPEHGLHAVAEDGSPVRDGRDPLTGLPVLSLYGDRFAPPVNVLRDLDLVLVDLPDVGARFYTYAWSMTHVLDACAASEVPVVVLDRPNPLGGRPEDAEGPLLELEFASFIGRLDIPIRHSLTLGELARLWQRERAPWLALDVVPCEGWSRDDQWPDTGLPWVPTSPAMPSFESALLYPGLCLFEATSVGVDRFGSAPFQCIAAPWLDASRIAQACADEAAAMGVCLRAEDHVVRLEVQDRRRVRPVRLGVALLLAVAAHHATEFRWVTYPTAANPSGTDHLERLFGTRALREAAITAAQLPDHALTPTAWVDRMRTIMLYT